MGVVVDSSVFIARQRQRFDWHGWIASLGDAEMFVTAVTLSELLHGAHRAQTDEQRESRLLFAAALERAKPGERILEIGTGSGYQAAVLAALGAEVYSIEIVKPLGEQARQVLRRLGHDRVKVRIGDGYAGWPEAAPFDKVIVTCAPKSIPQPLIDQLKTGGRMIIPVGAGGAQQLHLLEKTAAGLRQTAVLPVRFVPMTGEAQKPPRAAGK